MSNEKRNNDITPPTTAMCAHSQASALFPNTRTLTRRKRLYCEDPNEFYDVRTTKNFVRKMRVSKYRRTQKFKILNKDVLHYGETLFKKLRSRQRPETKASRRQKPKQKKGYSLPPVTSRSCNIMQKVTLFATT